MEQYIERIHKRRAVSYHTHLLIVENWLLDFQYKNKIHLSSNELDSISRIRKETIKSIVKGGDYLTDGMILRGKYVPIPGATFPSFNGGLIKVRRA